MGLRQDNSEKPKEETKNMVKKVTELKFKDERPGPLGKELV